ncbi:MAG: hypothetical protein JW991_04685 [Candidatus Pacebacteria bacterium]|nr:hypothetical protein [Candidatus Paceibacterota bacterium]
MAEKELKIEPVKTRLTDFYGKVITIEVSAQNLSEASFVADSFDERRGDPLAESALMTELMAITHVTETEFFTFRRLWRAAAAGGGSEQIAQILQENLTHSFSEKSVFDRYFSPPDFNFTTEPWSFKAQWKGEQFSVLTRWTDRLLKAACQFLQEGREMPGGFFSLSQLWQRGEGREKGFYSLSRFWQDWRNLGRAILTHWAEGPDDEINFPDYYSLVSQLTLPDRCLIAGEASRPMDGPKTAAVQSSRPVSLSRPFLLNWPGPGADNSVVKHRVDLSFPKLLKGKALTEPGFPQLGLVAGDDSGLTVLDSLRTTYPSVDQPRLALWEVLFSLGPGHDELLLAKFSKHQPEKSLNLNLILIPKRGLVFGLSYIWKEEGFLNGGLMPEQVLVPIANEGCYPVCVLVDYPDKRGVVEEALAQERITGGEE